MMIRRRTYRNNVKTAQIARMHRVIDASVPLATSRGSLPKPTSEQAWYGQDALDAFDTQHGRIVTGFAVVFEHGHLWIISKTGAIWSVVDAVGGNSVDGFDFALVQDHEEAPMRTRTQRQR